MIGPLLRQTLLEPRAAARWLMGLHLEARLVWKAFALLMVLGMMLGLLTQLAFPVPRELMDQMPLLRLQSQPLLAGAIQGLFLVGTAWAIMALGRRFGGTARFEQALLLVTWMEFVLLVVQAAQILAMLIVPPMATLLGFAGFALFFMLLTVFTAEANGFKRLPLVFLSVLVCLLLTALVAGVLFVFFGVMPMPHAGT